MFQLNNGVVKDFLYTTCSFC